MDRESLFILGLHSEREELSGIVPVRRTVRIARVRRVKARDLQRYSSNTVLED